MLDWYPIFKLLHVMSAIIWLGGALIMVILAMRADRSRNDAAVVETVRQVAWAAERVYVPASIATLVFGLLAAWIGSLWLHLWIIVGLVGVAATIALGVGVLTPRAKKVETGYVARGLAPDVVATSREIIAIAKFDMVLLFTIVADMVLKPQPGHWLTLLLMGLAIVAAAATFLPPAFRKTPATA
jgi:uncharacterized membrane protein